MAIYDVNGNELITESSVSMTIPDTSLSAYDSRVKAINHRGYRTVAPENTAPAFKLSKTNGFFYVESDVQFTSDGVPVMIHDAYINDVARNADGTEIATRKYIASITYEEALTYDFGVWKSSDYSNTKILSFVDFITLCKKIGLHPYIELKAVSSMPSHIAELLGIVKDKGMRGKVTWISFNNSYLHTISLSDSSARLGLLVNSITNDVISNAIALKTGSNDVFVDASISGITQEAILLCKQNNLPLEVWTLNNTNQILEMDSYITGVTSDSLIAGQILYNSVIS